MAGRSRGRRLGSRSARQPGRAWSRADFLDNYDTHQVGGRTIVEYWIPAKDLGRLNASIVGRIEYHRD
jgi:hypothetical protein